MLPVPVITDQKGRARKYERSFRNARNRLPMERSDVAGVSGAASGRGAVRISTQQDPRLKPDRDNPTLLYGYGGFSNSLTPRYRPDLPAWLERGGIFVRANIRGGGVYGEAWHRAGMLDKKQNSFDDFIAVAENLVSGGQQPAAGSLRRRDAGRRRVGYAALRQVYQRRRLDRRIRRAFGPEDVWGPDAIFTVA